MSALTETDDTSTEKSTGKVLIVDDNAFTANALAKVLAAARYDPAVVLRGTDALQFAGENRCAAAFVDIHLPDLNGLVVSQKLREIMGPAAPIVVLSGDTSMEVINALPHVGATYFFSKPINAPYLLERLGQWLAAR